MKLSSLPPDYLVRINRLSAEELKEQLRSENKSVSGFADQLRHEYDHLWRRIDAHPFLVEIEEGKLPIEKYKTYAIQNYFYICEHVRCLGSVMARAFPLSYAFIFSRLLQLVPDFGSQDFAFPKIAQAAGISDAEFDRILSDPSLVLRGSQAYVDFMYKMFSTGTPGVAVASFIACPWTYTERDLGGLACARRVAHGLGKQLGLSKDVVDAYTLEEGYSDWHLRYMRIVKDIVNAEAQNDKDVQDRMRDAFRRNSEFEFTFWDQAYIYEPRKKITEPPLVR